MCRFLLRSTRRPLICLALTLGLSPVGEVLAQTAPVSIALPPTPAPAAAEPGVTPVNLLASGFPAGPITASAVQVTLQPKAPATGPAMVANVTAVTTVVGSSRRVTFLVSPANHANNVTTPTVYLVYLSGTTTAGVAFASSNTSQLIINPPASISLNPASGGPGQSLTVTITGDFSSFFQGGTQASFGPGISVGGATAGGYGPVRVMGPTAATALLVIDPVTGTGNRDVSVKTGAEIATSVGGFTVSGTPAITLVNPNGGEQGQNLSVTISGSFTHFTTASVVTFSGSGVTAGAATAATATSLTVPVTITGSAPLGAQGIQVVSGAETVSLANAFTVTQGTAVITLVNPNSGQQGQNLSVTISGNFTHWLQSTTSATFGAGITVASLTVNSTTNATAVLNIDPAAAVGARNVTLTTGAEVVTLTSGFTVTALAPVLTAVNPSTGQQGQSNLNVNITGHSTHFAQGVTVANFGAGITVASLTVNSVTSASAVLNIDFAAATGTRNVSLTSGSEVATLSNGFAITPVSPSLVSVSPNTAQQGTQNVSVLITGQQTHFVQGTTIAIFGTGISVVSLTVNSQTTATAVFNISANATAGSYSPTMSTGLEVVTLTNGFTVTGLPVVTQVNPTSVQRNQTNVSVSITGQFTHWVQATTTADFGNGITTASLTVNSTTTATAVINVSGTAAIGLHSVTTQTGGEQALLANAFGVAQAAAAPTVTISTPTDSATVTTLTNVIGTVSSPILKTWTLEYMSANSGTFLPITTSSAPVSNALLGVLDPTLLLNGILTLQLRATDLTGVTSTTLVSVFIGSNQKVGNFSVSFLDMTVPLPGFNLDIVRTYDTRTQVAGDFGAGWTFSFKSVRASENRVIGSGWQQTFSGGIFGTYCVGELNSHIISVTFPDNTVYKFRPVLNISGLPSSNCQELVPIDQLSGGTVSFTALPGTTATITSTVPFDMFDQGGVGPLDLVDSSFNTVDLTSLTLQLTDGSTYNVDLSTGLTSAQDPNGNTISIGPNGITHSSGRGAVFTRDLSSRITQIADPAGNNLKYGYDLNGNLSSSTDRANNTTTYQYNVTHGLLQINDPRGFQPIRNVYDDSGRLIQQIDSFGHVTNYSHNLGLRQDIVTDRLGRATVFGYDADGNVTSEQDPLGNLTTRTYDAQDHVLTETDPLGHTRTFTYDANGNRLTEKDPLNNTTTNVYDAGNRLLTRTDPLGHVLANTYDANGNLLTIKDALGNTTTYVVNAQGRRTSQTDALNNTTTYTYDAFGNKASQTDPFGVTMTYTYDPDGNKLSESFTRATPSGPEVLTTQYQYDPNGRLVKTTYPDGSTVQNTYNSIGKLASKTDQLGRVTTYRYDALVNPNQTVYADGTSEIKTYDADGQLVAETDRLSRVTSYQYDAGRRLIKTTYPDGSFTTSGYDAAGRVTSTTDTLGQLTATTYDACGRVTHIMDALNHATTFTYDAVGNQLTKTDANGPTTQYQYDAMNRKIKTIYPDGTFATVTYDALGRVSSKTDQANKTTQFQYDALGRLTTVTDAVGQISKSAYDAAGNRIAQVDGNNHTTTFGYDRLGRMIKRTLPGGQFETFTYDAAGNLVSHTDFSGKVTTMTYDVLHRQLTKSPDASFAAPTVSFTYTGSGKRASMADATGATIYSYDARDRLVSKATPFGTLSYAYTTEGKVSSIQSSNAGGTNVTYAYDGLNRLQTVVDNVLPGSSTYTYDLVGNLATVGHPNGVGTTYSYDTLNRLANEVIAKGGTLASYAYTLGAAGNRTAVSELGGRSVNYGYDANYRLTSEAIAGSPTPANNGTIGYVYDAAGNRLSRNSTSAGVPTTSYSYDVNDRLTLDTYDANGNTTGSGPNIYTYDFEDRLKTATGGVSYVYDGDGRRVQKVSGAGTVSYLIDDRNPCGLPQILEELSAGVIQKVYVYGLNRISQRQGAVTSFYGYDGRGSVRLLTNTAGAITDAYNYDAFGIKLESAGVTPNDFLFSGEQFDPSLQYYYMRARYMNQGTGRFLTMDPLLGVPNDPPSLHRYLYAGSDPVNRTDATGQQFSLVEISISISIDTSLQQIYTTQLVHTFFDVMRIAYCCLEPAARLRDVALDLVASGGPDWAFDLYNGAAQAEAMAYQMIAARIGQTYRNILHDIGHAEFEVKTIFDDKITKEIDLADILGLPDFTDTLKTLQTNIDGFLSEWQGLLDGAASSGNCDVAMFIAKWGTKLFDKLIGKLYE